MRALLALLVMSNLILPKRSVLWLPDHQLVTPAQAIVPPRPQFMGVAGPPGARAAGGVGSVAPGGGGLVELAFASQWRQTGNTTTQRTDLGRWQSASGCNVIAAGDAHVALSGWPTINALRVPTAVDDIAGGNLRISIGNLPDLEVGQSIYTRIYLAHTMGNIVDSNVPGDHSAHPIEDIHAGGADEETGIGTRWLNTNGASFYPNWVPSFGASDFRHFIAATGGQPGLGQPMPVILFDSNKPYRFEWRRHRTSTTQYTVQARIYDEAVSLTVPLVDENDFYAPEGDILAGMTHTILDAATFRQLAVGSNQGAFFPSGATPAYYQGAVAVSYQGWPGPFHEREYTYDS